MIMDTVKLANKGKVQMVAHRGLSAIETENTAAAFIAAANRSYYGIETDVHRTADGKFVCLHDDHTKRVAKEVVTTGDNTYDRLAQVQLYDTAKGMGERRDLVPPMLEDYISICKAYGKHSVLELKDQFTIDELKTIIKILDKADHLQDTTFITFYPQNLFKIRSLLPEQSCQALTDRMNDIIFNGIIQHKLDIDILHTVLDQRLADRLKENGIKINAWTVDDPKDAERLISLGVDFITTNILE